MLPPVDLGSAGETISPATPNQLAREQSKPSAHVRELADVGAITPAAQRSASEDREFVPFGVCNDPALVTPVEESPTRHDQLLDSPPGAVRGYGDLGQ